MIKRYVGLDFVDLLIHAGVTIALAVALAGATAPQEEIAVGFVFAASFAALAWRRARAMRQLAQEEAGTVPGERVLELEERVAQLEAGQDRMLELEERLDFAERLLTRERDRVALPGPGGAP